MRATTSDPGCNLCARARDPDGQPWPGEAADVVASLEEARGMLKRAAELLRDEIGPVLYDLWFGMTIGAPGEKELSDLRVKLQNLVNAIKGMSAAKPLKDSEAVKGDGHHRHAGYGLRCSLPHHPEGDHLHEKSGAHWPRDPEVIRLKAPTSLCKWNDRHAGAYMTTVQCNEPVEAGHGYELWLCPRHVLKSMEENDRRFARPPRSETVRGRSFSSPSVGIFDIGRGNQDPRRHWGEGER